MLSTGEARPCACARLYTTTWNVLGEHRGSPLRHPAYRKCKGTMAKGIRYFLLNLLSAEFLSEQLIIGGGQGDKFLMLTPFIRVQFLGLLTI